MARSKMFKEPPVDLSISIWSPQKSDLIYVTQVSLRPKEELDHIAELYKDYDKRWYLGKWNWFMMNIFPRMAALRYFLYQDDLKAGDTGAAAQLEAQKEEEEHIKLIQVFFPHRK